ncbi:hypothetical protein BD413DRAFT_610311 [Trametes elegans]|nr:hypothetical protein BD413DRAFT_610311 [Trametes elegans]
MHDPKNRHGSESPVYDGLALRGSAEADAFANALLARDPSDPLTDLSPHLILGYEITSKQPPIDASQARRLWQMLGRMKHLERLTLEDPDGILMLVPAEDVQNSPLSLPNLKHIKYCATFSLDFCHTFLSALRDVELETILLRYPKEYDQESDDETSDPLALLARPCASRTLEVLEVENLRYEYFDFSANTQFPALGTLTFEFSLDHVSPRMPILGYLLACFPNLYSLDIATSAPPHPLSPVQRLPFQQIRLANVQAQAASTTQWSLSRVTASLSDLWILGLRCPTRLVDILQIDLATIQSTDGLMQDLFADTVPSVLYLNYKETASSPPQVATMFFGLLSAYWTAFPLGSVPKEVEIELGVKELGALHMMLTYAFALVTDSPRLESYTLLARLRCRDRHEDGGGPATESDASESDESDSEAPAGTLQCFETAYLFNDLLPRIGAEHELAFNAATDRGQQLFVKVSSYCEPDGHWLVSSSGRQNRVLSWLQST